MRELDSEAAGRGRSFLLLPSKITCPAPEPDAIERPRVREKLAQAIARPVTTLVAPAGFGKTTALAAWADRLDGPVAWCALEEDDSDPSRFWHALACALARADERLGAPRNMAEVAWTEAVEAREALTELLAQLGAFPDTAVLVVEDRPCRPGRAGGGRHIGLLSAQPAAAGSPCAHLAHAPQGAVG